jgi:tRNA (guanine37-N1)-methyltransferase
MKITIVTLFPQMFIGPFDESIIKRAREKKLIEINFINIRDFGIGKHKTVDDTPYGGGNGMVLRVDVLKKAIEKARLITLGQTKNKKNKNEKVVLLSPHGKQFNQNLAQNFAKLDHLILVCGHYEGFDTRIRKFIDEEVSIGDFILTGGELAAALIVDATARLIKGVLKEGSAEKESFSPFLEYNQYTKPLGYERLKVPSVLLSGNHAEIEKWRKEQSLKITSILRPDLLKTQKDSH